MRHWSFPCLHRWQQLRRQLLPRGGGGQKPPAIPVRPPNAVIARVSGTYSGLIGHAWNLWENIPSFPRILCGFMDDELSTSNMIHNAVGGMRACGSSPPSQNDLHNRPTSLMNQTQPPPTNSNHQSGAVFFEGTVLVVV